VKKYWQTVSHNVVSLSVTCGRSVVLSGYSDWHLTICKGSHEAHYKLAIFYNTYSIKNTFSHIVLGFCFVCIRLVYLMLPVSLDCSFWLSLNPDKTTDLPQVTDKLTTLCDTVCQWLVAGWWFSPDTPVSSISRTNRHDITEILLKVAINTIKPNQTNQMSII
jgi:hypothetical protein